MILAALLLLAASQPRTFAEERALLDRRLEALRRLLPDGPSAPADVAQLREAAQAARLQSFEAAPRAPVEATAIGHVVVDIAGNGRFADVERFFRQLALLAAADRRRGADLEGHARGAGAADRGGPFSVPAQEGPAAAAARAARGRPPARRGRRWRRSCATTRWRFAKSEALASLRRSRRNPRLFLSELAAVARERPVVCTEAEPGRAVPVRGLTVGEHPSRELEAASSAASSASRSS